MLWGFLDNLAWAFNFLFGLGFDDLDEKGRIRCSFSQKSYRRKLKEKDPALAGMIEVPAVSSWISDLKIKRHPAAHREPLFLSTVLDADMTPIGDTMIVSNKDSRIVMFDALNHLEYDLERLAELMDSVCNRFGVAKIP